MNERAQTFDVVVAGGGLSGLAAAEAILRRSPELRVVCLEARERAGGSIQTVQRNGFLMEAGPAGFLDKTGALLRLASVLGLEDQLIQSDSSDPVRWVRRSGQLHQFPSSIGSFLKSDLLSARGKLRMLLEPLQPHHDREETVTAFATRRLGREAAQVLVDPIVSGIYAADAEKVSLQASIPHLAALEHKKGSLLTTFLRSTGKVKPLISFRDGCEQLIERLHLRVLASGGSVRCNSPIEEVGLPGGNGNEFTIRIGGSRPEVIRSRALVSAAPAIAAARFLASLDARIAGQLAQVRYASVAVVSIGFRREAVPNPLRGFGYLVPKCEASPVLGVQWSSSIYPDNRTRDDKCLLRMFLGGACHPEIARESEEDLLEIASDELRKTLGVQATPVASMVHRHVDAMPQYLLKHRQRVEDIERRSAEIPGLFIGGNGLRALGMDSLVHDAELQAAAAIEFLEQTTSSHLPQVFSPHHEHG